MISYKRDVLERQSLSQVRWSEAFRNLGYITFSCLADDFIQRNLQMRTIEVIKINEMQEQWQVSVHLPQYTYQGFKKKLYHKKDRMEKE